MSRDDMMGFVSAPPKANAPKPKPKVDDHIPPPIGKRFAESTGDKYNFGLLQKINQSLFVPLENPDEANAARNLRANIIQHATRFYKSTGKKLLVRKDITDDQVGFRIWLLKITKPKG
jgi:hypothetical protein